MPTISEAEAMTHAEWVAEGDKLFGHDTDAWRFECPVCKHVASVGDYKAAGAPEAAVAFSCIGRWLENARPAFEERGVGPCTYAGGGLFKLNPVTVVDLGGRKHHVFAFAAAVLA